MKILFFSILLSLSSIGVYAQSTEIVSTAINVSLSGKVFNKVSGEQLSDEEISELFKKYPNIILESSIDKYGRYTEYYFDPNDIRFQKFTKARSEDAQVGLNKSLPEFVFKSIDDEVISSENLKGSWILLRFDLFSRFANVSEIMDLDKQIKQLNAEISIVPIIVLADSEQNIKNSFSQYNWTFKLVGNGRNFHEKYNIIQFPTTLILDDSGRVYRYYFMGDKIDIDALIKR